MDETKVILGVGPTLCHVVYFESDIEWDVGRLGRGEIDTDDLGTFELISKVTDVIIWSAASVGQRQEQGGTYITQMPVPVPTSKTRLGVCPMGARNSSPLSARV